MTVLAGKAVAVELTERDKAILDFEGSWWTEQGEKDVLVLERFGLAPDQYIKVLHEILERPEAFEHDPLVVRRLLRLRERNRRARSEHASRAASAPVERGHA